MSEADALIRTLELSPHPEGGWYRESFRDRSNAAGRAHGTAIYFLLKAGEMSRWHRIDAVEIWHFYRGSPLEVGIAREGLSPIYYRLGPQVEAGHVPQLVVPARAWQCARPLGAYGLVGCTVAPGFEFAHFELAPKDFQP
ncbi:MAG: cupin domain-containing protein [Alphaproteobacteria bacterium]|nr:cupin domain-containing protein [Alphaproteobacteria bacterium]